MLSSDMFSTQLFFKCFPYLIGFICGYRTHGSLLPSLTTNSSTVSPLFSQGNKGKRETERQRVRDRQKEPRLRNWGYSFVVCNLLSMYEFLGSISGTEKRRRNRRKRVKKNKPNFRHTVYNFQTEDTHTTSSIPTPPRLTNRFFSELNSKVICLVHVRP